MSLRCVILGGGGHARVVIDALRANGLEPAAIVDRDLARRDTFLDGVRFAGDDSELPSLRASGVTHFVMGFAGAGNNAPRQRAFEQARALGLLPLTLVHPRAIVSPAAKLGDGCQVLAGAVVNAGAVLGENVIANTATIIEHDCEIASHVHIASGACLCGAVRVEEAAHIGARGVVRQLIRVGARAIIAAGAVVVDDVAAGTTVAGIPARPISTS